jgi:hypothetical protein
VISDSEIASVFTVTFSLTVPHVITSAPGAVFTLDRKTATWKLSWTRAETLVATTGPDTSPAAALKPAPDTRLALAVGVMALAVGILLGVLMTWQRMRPLIAISAEQRPPTETPPES